MIRSASPEPDDDTNIEAPQEVSKADAETETDQTQGVSEGDNEMEGDQSQEAHADETPKAPTS